MKNEKEVEFLGSVMQAVNKASAMQTSLYESLLIGGVIQNHAAIDYYKSLTSFIEAGLRIALNTHLAYSEGPAEIITHIPTSKN
jgi:hypothetical protein